eukprot:s659_g23.t1
MALKENEENIKSEAAQHVLAHEAQCKVKVEAYQRILDANLRQSMATKDGEIAQLRKEAMERDRVQEERIKKLEELLMQQSLQNQKLQSLLDSQLAEPYVLSAPLGTIPYGNIDVDPFDEGDYKGSKKGGGPPGGDGGENGDGGGDGGDTPPASPSIAPEPSKPNKSKKKAPGGGDGGDDGDDPGKDSDDSDEKFVRRMREAIVAASTNPDTAFEWIGEVWKEGQTIEALRKVAPFATLDAKLLSALTNIITGDFARKVDTFKETEANDARIVRGRQVLYMLHDHFSTNMKHGSTYALQDLFSVHLKGENLKTFISNWDQVLAGIVKMPDESVLETLFYNQVKNCKAISHDMNEYHRAEEGTEKRKYDFLVSAVCRHLDRERLETNRERVARNLSGAAKPSTPAVGEKVGFIPKGYGYCVK